MFIVITRPKQSFMYVSVSYNKTLVQTVQNQTPTKEEEEVRQKPKAKKPVQIQWITLLACTPALSATELTVNYNYIQHLRQHQ